MALICDTGPLYAAMDRTDHAHRSCAALLEEHEEALIVPAPVVVELEWLVASRLGDEVFDSFLESIEDGAIEIEALADGTTPGFESSPAGTPTCTLASWTRR